MDRTGSGQRVAVGANHCAEKECRQKQLIHSADESQWELTEDLSDLETAIKLTTCIQRREWLQ